MKYHYAADLDPAASVVLAADVDALAAELADWKRHAMAIAISNRDRISALEAALREIAGGLMPEDSAADHHNRYELCVGRLCKIARNALTAPETASKPAGYMGDINGPGCDPDVP